MSIQFLNENNNDVQLNLGITFMSIHIYMYMCWVIDCCSFGGSKRCAHDTDLVDISGHTCFCLMYF